MRQPTITEHAFHGIEEWVARQEQNDAQSHYEVAEAALLFRDLPQGSIRGAELIRHKGGQLAADVSLRRPQKMADRKHTPTMASCRRVNLPFLAVLRLGLVAGDTCYLDSNSRAEAPEETKRFYIEIIARLGLTALRLIADAGLGEVVTEAADHTVLLREELYLTTTYARRAEGKPSQGTYRDRKLFIDAVCENLVRAQQEQRMPFDLSEAKLRDLLQRLFILLDRHPLGVSRPDYKRPETEDASAVGGVTLPT